MYRGYRVRHRTDKSKCPDTDDHKSAEINVKNMSQKYTFCTEKNGETYGDVKTALLDVLEPKQLRLRRQLVFADLDTSDIIDDTTALPKVGPIEIEFFVKEMEQIEWSDSELEFKENVKIGELVHNSVVQYNIDAFLCALQEKKKGKKVKKMNIRDADLSFVFNTIRLNPNIEELDFEYYLQGAIQQQGDLRIPSVKKLKLNGEIDAQTVFNIVRSNPTIEHLYINGIFKPAQMRDLFYLILETGQLSFLQISLRLRGIDTIDQFCVLLNQINENFGRTYTCKVTKQEIIKITFER